MERLRDLVAAADRAVSELEMRLQDGTLAPSKELQSRLRTAREAVWVAAARYLNVVDGLMTAGDSGVVDTARHTGLLGPDEADEMERLLHQETARPPQDLAATRNQVRILRLWLERVRDTAAKAST